ncbi:biotin--[acetyl-CoA-carboxylase] ligase [Geobacter sp. AOG1]|uniref:biotin--[acetyl-CoA-carboxylase] ligase n=1 Tax=Geobacter sp. AOG1 TaxID=1566346 RepID=UPI001DDECAAF|nr:biotin--[acetyl-CoA-carboxylase] ligase [Geobacter sp. AOG1]GFE58701.1 bifunctional ligase/repressor BirA [Geobacter sp. AOG1]
MKEDFLRHAAMDDKTIDQRILEIFRATPGGIVSGEELSSRLKVSRTAVWKHIKSLKDLGYRIEAVPSVGYRLVAVPDLLLPAEIAVGLMTKRIGRQIISFRETDSTNETAFKLAEEGAPEGTVIIAESQRRGKGRMGRQWESPPGVNLYCSIILRPPILPLQAVQLTFLSAVAVARAVEETTPLVPTIKWPNDVLLSGRKVAGLLNEMGAETEKVNFIILGIGVNINMEEGQFPADLRYPATSLRMETGGAVNRMEFTRAFIRAVDNLYSAFMAGDYGVIRDEWLARCSMIGQRVHVSYRDSVVAGVATGIDDYGALLLNLDDGRVERVLAGDVSLV